MSQELLKIDIIDAFQGDTFGLSRICLECDHLNGCGDCSKGKNLDEINKRFQKASDSTKIIDICPAFENTSTFQVWIR